MNWKHAARKVKLQEYCQQLHELRIVLMKFTELFIMQLFNEETDLLN